MGKLLVSLNKQLKTENKEDAEACLKIYSNLKDTTGSVWESQWNVLVNTTYEGKYPNSKRISKPNAIGRMVLSGS